MCADLCDVDDVTRYRIFDIELFRDYPYLLPMVVVSAISVVAVTLAYFYLEETLGVVKDDNQIASPAATRTATGNTDMPAAADSRLMSSSSDGLVNANVTGEQRKVMVQSPITRHNPEGAQSCIGTSSNGEGSSNGSSSGSSSGSSIDSSNNGAESNQNEGWYSPSNLSVATYAVLSFQAIGFDDVYNVWCGTYEHVKCAHPFACLRVCT